jgi:hypothetical protein
VVALDEGGSGVKGIISLLALVAVLAFSGAALADPKSEDKGCHGFHTTQFKEMTGDRGAQGEAIGGRGNSDGDPTNGQAHSAAGRGATLQAFLAAECGVGSQAP